MNSHALSRCGSLVVLGMALTAATVLGADKPQRDRIEFGKGVVAKENRPIKSPDGKRTIRGAGTAVARLIDVETGKPAGPALKHTEEYKVHCWAFSPDGKLVATGAGCRHESGRNLFDNEGEIRVWEVATGKQVAMFNKEIGSVRALEFTKDSDAVRFEAARHEQSGK